MPTARISAAAINQINFMGYFIYIVIYFLGCYLIWRLALKMGVKTAWFAFLPFANDYLVSRLANKHFGWWLLFYIPIVNIYVAYVFWTEIMRRFKKPFWLGLLMFLPFINLLFLVLLVFVFKYPPAEPVKVETETPAPVPAPPEEAKPIPEPMDKN